MFLVNPDHALVWCYLDIMDALSADGLAENTADGLAENTAVVTLSTLDARGVAKDAPQSARQHRTKSGNW